jgi:hypothetical protein
LSDAPEDFVRESLILYGTRQNNGTDLRGSLKDRFIPLSTLGGENVLGANDFVLALENRASVFSVGFCPSNGSRSTKSKSVWPLPTELTRQQIANCSKDFFVEFTVMYRFCHVGNHLRKTSVSLDHIGQWLCKALPVL